jgi:Sugar phosphate isomerases/epimerases
MRKEECGMQQLKYAVSVTDELVSVNSPIMLRGSFEQCFRDAAECGYDGVELQLKNPGSRNPAQIIELLEKNRLQAAAITTGMEYFGNGLSMIAEDQAVQDQAVIRLIEHVELAQKLNCKVVFGSMRGSIENFSRLNQMEDRLIGNLNKVLDVAVARNVDMVIEPINLYVNNYINSLPEGIKFINRIGVGRLGMLIDTHHMRLHDGDMYEAILKSAPYIHYVHYSDSNRYYPGGGNIDFLQCTRALLTAGYQGWITLECLPLDDGKTCAAKGLRYCRDLEKACNAILSAG